MATPNRSRFFEVDEMKSGLSNGQTKDRAVDTIDTRQAGRLDTLEEIRDGRLVRNPDAYAKRSAKNREYNTYRQHHAVSLPEEVFKEAPPNGLLETEEHEAFEATCNRLDTPSQAILSLLAAGLTASQVAGQLGCSRPTIYRKLRLLRNQLNEIHEELFGCLLRRPRCGRKSRTST
ncbi:MAG: helix-turn-helix domain-containing protein [Phycisphaerales bacterium]